MNTEAKYDALVMAVMRGTHREARDLARARFVEMCPEERGHAEKVARDSDKTAALEAEIARLRGGLNDTNTDLLALIDMYEAERKQFSDGIAYLQSDLKKALSRAGDAEKELERLFAADIEGVGWRGAYREERARSESAESRIAALEALALELAGALGSIHELRYAPEYHQHAMGCGVEDRCLQRDGYGAAEYGWEDAAERFAQWAVGSAEDALSSPLLAELRAKGGAE